MPPLRQLFRSPRRFVRSLYREAQQSLYKRIASRQFRNIRRGQRLSCWCGGALLAFRWRASWGICSNCRAYVNRRPPVLEDLEELYSMSLYWETKQKTMGYPTIENRAALYKSDGRLDQWLRLVEQYGPGHGQVIEVGCAPGVLLKELQACGYQCVGVEISKDVADWVRQTTGLDIRSGFFPGVDLPQCDVFLAFDVLEHSPCPESFLRQVSGCLLPEGVAIIQTAIDRYEYDPPFGKRFKDMFDDLEHLFLFTDDAMKALALKAGLEIVSLAQGIWVGAEICIFRKPR